MVSKSHAKRRQDIKTKLMAAIAMLLVSSIMMVSSTYAWFTLSTAPEVTGISTSVGANGNLEIALFPHGGDINAISSAVGDSVVTTQDVTKSNITWGNIIDLRQYYGLEAITLYPSQLNTNESTGKIDVLASILKSPKYGFDGRVSELGDTSTGAFKGTSFFPAGEDVPETGVRAIGVASGMSDRELAFRNARAAASGAASAAKNKASQSLNINGSALASIAVKKATATEGAEPTYTADDVRVMRVIINALKGDAATGEVGALQYVETAFKQYVLAIAASDKVAETSTDGKVDEIQPWETISGMISANTLNEIITEIETYADSTIIPADIDTAIEKYEDALENVDGADTALKTLEATLATNPDATFGWNDISPVLTKLADPDNMTLNGYSLQEAKANINAIATDVMSKGANVKMQSGAGVYADIADLCGDYHASVKVDITYGSINLEGVDAKMSTATDVEPPYLDAIAGVMQGYKAPTASGAAQPLTDMYGYIIDLAFRTNAANSDLELQIDAVDRIYDNNNNTETMGGGSSMTFSVADGFPEENAKALMKNIKIIFFNPDDGTVYCNVALDADNATYGADGWTAKMMVVSAEATYKVAAEGETATHKEVITYVEATVEEGATHYYDTTDSTYKPADDNNAATHKEVITYEPATEGATHVRTLSNKLLSLTQNAATKVSVLVYLDGTSIQNKDVAANGTNSLSGTMNLQFASSANLVPMEYAGLHTPAAEQNP